MKHPILQRSILGLLLFALLALAPAGCSTTRDPAQHAKACAYYEAILAAYQVTVQDRKPSAAEIAAAQVAAVFIRVHCADVAPTGDTRGTRKPSDPAGFGDPIEVDQYGVPVR